ncbi:hypothetical protein [Laspinema palackyanum]|uniref:hypothetical protein n=1 Tax=Laspinema palackyanum TaxID=3231601 RepID=UPI00345CCA59|nr:hypothetical protein [Laspinema sp. D2c]
MNHQQSAHFQEKAPLPKNPNARVFTPFQPQSGRPPQQQTPTPSTTSVKTQPKIPTPQGFYQFITFVVTTSVVSGLFVVTTSVVS